MPEPIRKPWDPEGELLRLETPEQIQVEFRIAPLGTRLAAVVLDLIVLFAATFLLIVGLLAMTALFLPSGSGGVLEFVQSISWLFATLIVLLFILWTFYFVYLEVRREGQTLGKKALGIRTVMESGQGLTFSAALLRNLARIVDHFPILLLIPAIDKGGRRIGDFIAGTLVVQVPQRVDPFKLPRRTRGTEGENLFFFASVVGDKVVPDDLNLLEHFFQRLPSVGTYSQQKKLIADLAERYRSRLEMDADKVQERPREFLEELYRHLQDRYDGGLLG